MLFQQKEELCEIARKLYQFQLVSGTDGNISLRVDNTSMLITPSGVNKGLLNPYMILHQSLDGTILEGSGSSTKEASIHSGIYKSRFDVNAIIHTHPACATAFAVCGKIIPENILIEVPVLLGKITLIPYAKPGSRELAEAVVFGAKNSNVLLLKNHGVLTCGKSLIDAYNKMDALENAAKTILLSKLIGTPELIPESELMTLRK